MKKLMVMLALALSPGLLFADTVMLLTRMQPPESNQGMNIERSIAVEDGVEDEFFSSGHIIFDPGLPSANDKVLNSMARSDSWAEQTAKTGGADLLLIVDLTFPGTQKEVVVPTGAVFRFFDLRSGSMLIEGSVDTSISKEELTSKKPYELCFALGQKIARNVILRWTPKKAVGGRSTSGAAAMKALRLLAAAHGRGSEADAR